LAVPRTRGKILVIRGGAIGDFILTLPALAALRQTFPETSIELLGYPKLAELARAGGVIDDYRAIEARALAGFFARKGKLDGAMAEFFASFAVIFSYLYDPDEIFKTNVLKSSTAQFVQGPHRPSEELLTHAVDVFLKPLEQFAIFDADPVPRLRMEPGERLPSGSWLAIHPGSGSAKKNWPEARWHELLKRLAAETRWNVLLVGGEAEEGRAARLARALPPSRVRSLENLPLATLAGWLQQTHAFVGHDSGITHLAAALGVPVLALWGESNHTIWRPRSPETRLLKADPARGGLDHLEVEAVMQELRSIAGLGQSS
jgi:heptosyltransferase III